MQVVDDKDRQLVGALRANGRLTYAELGRLVGLSGPSATDRVQRLEQAGIITGYHAAVSPEAIGRGVSALIGVYLTDSADQDRVCAAMQALPEAEDCWFVAGEESFIVKVRTADVPALEGCISRLRRLDGVARTRTTVVLSTKWEGKVAPLQPDEQPDEPADQQAEVGQ
jgi:Lrp/AsnC family leucine-responsive transcriptional regulator